MKTELIELDRLRKAKQLSDERHKALIISLEEENKAFFNERNQIADELAQAEEKVREIGLSLYGQTGEKHLFGGVLVKEREKIGYDPAVGLLWAQDNCKMLVKTVLDEKGFTKLLKGMENKPEFVTIEKIPFVTIPKELNLVAEE